MKIEKTSVNAKIEVPACEVGDGLWIVAVAFRFKENAETAINMLRSSGIDASLTEIPPEDPEDPEDPYFTFGMRW